MKNGKSNLYFLLFDDCFKLGVTTTLKKRLLAVAKEEVKEIDYRNSFYYELSDSVSFGLENSLLIKYKEHTVENAHHKTEVFNLDAIEDMEKDVIAYHKIFDYEVSRKNIIDKYVLVYDNDIPRVQYTKDLKRIYDIFKGHEEYFDHIFQADNPNTKRSD